MTSDATVVGLVSPGEMGSALGAVLGRGGVRVLASTHGRSERTRRLAREAGLDLVDDVDDVVRSCSVVLSVVPPDQAGDVAADVAARARRLGVRPTFVDLNAIDPAEVERLAAVVADAGLDLVDGAVSGAPPTGDGARSRLLLSGPGAAGVAALPWGAVRVSVLGDRVGAASASKMCTGGVRKGLSGLVVNALLTAAHYDVIESVEVELRGALGRDPLLDAELAASKAWRFVPEMEAVARTQEAAGLDPAPYLALADVFRRTALSPLGRRRPEDVVRSGGAEPVAERRTAVAAGLVPDPTRWSAGRMR